MEALGIISLIVGIVAGTVAAIDYGIENKKTVDKLGDEEDYLTQQYNDKNTELTNSYNQALENAELSYNQNKESEELKVKQNLESLENSYNESVNDTTLNFNENKKEANYKADTQDKADTFSEWNYTQDLNNQLGILQMNQKGLANSFNQSNVSIGQGTGNALSAAAASGTRTSSMNTAIELDKANNALQLQLSEDQTRQQLTGQYNSVLLQNAQNNFALQQSRDASNYLRNSYEAGGKNYNIYQNTLADLSQNYQLAVNQTNESANQYYNQILASWNTEKNQLKTNYDQSKLSVQHTYDYNYKNLSDERDERSSFWYNALNGTAAFLTTSSKAFATSEQISGTVKNYFQ